MNKLSSTGLLRLSDVIGEKELTHEQAADNSEYNKRVEREARNGGRLDKRGKPIYSRRPTKPRPGKQAIIPVKKSCFWAGVASGRFPKPVKIGNGRGTFWRVEDIRALIEGAD